MKKIIIIDHFSQTPDEAGNNRFLYIAELLSKEGYQVEIITSDYSHKNKRKRETYWNQKLPKYQFTMLKEPGYQKNVSIIRFYSHFIFGKSLKRYLKKIEKPSLVYAAVPSLDAAYVGAEYCRKYKIPFIVDIQDLWPEAFKLVFDMPVVSNMIFQPMVFAANRIYKSADEIVAVSRTYLERGLLVTKRCKGITVFLGTDIERFDKAAERRLEKENKNEIWVVYAGTLGHSYNIEIIIDAIKLLKTECTKPVRFKVLGDGPFLNRFKAYAVLNEVETDFMGRLPYEEMVSYLKSSDIAVNPITKGAAQSIINKHGDYAAAGLPVISTQECREYRELLVKYQAGINCPPNSVSHVVQAMKFLILHDEERENMARGSRKMAEELFDRRYTNRKIIEAIVNMAGLADE